MVERIAWFVVGAVVVAWLATTLLFPFVVTNYTPPPSIGPLMGSLAGGAAAYLFAKQAKKNGNGGNSKTEPPREIPPGQSGEGG